MKYIDEYDLVAAIVTSMGTARQVEKLYPTGVQNYLHLFVLLVMLVATADSTFGSNAIVILPCVGILPKNRAFNTRGDPNSCS